MTKITRCISVICAIFLFAFTTNAQTTSAQVANNVTVSAEMQAQIQEAMKQQTRPSSQTFNRAVTPTYVGSFETNDGPSWVDNPRVYTGQEAAALNFGGLPSYYVISVNPDTGNPATITHTVHASTYAVGGCSEIAEDYSLDLGAPGYKDPEVAGSAISAYVQDNCTSGGTNYVWSVRDYTTFITTWKTDNPGTSNSTSITIPTFSGETYSYDVSWKNDGVWETGFTGNATHDYGTAGTYAVAIRGDFPRIYFNYVGDREKILSIEQWGTNAWSSMRFAFRGCSNLVGNATDAPDLSVVTDMYAMFANVFSFNGNIGNWNVSNVTDMSFMFSSVTAFSQNIGSWNVGNVTKMRGMFRDALAFNGNVGNWNVSNVTDMSFMFNGVTLSTANYDALLNGWSALTLKNGVTFDAGNSQYCAGQTARANIIANFGWTINDAGSSCDSCGDLTEYSGGSWSNGVPTPGKKAIFSNDYNTTDGSIDACSIEIKPGVTVTVSVNTTIKAAKDIAINGYLIFLSNGTGNGELAEMGPTSTITGNATVHRYMMDRRGYRMVSPAVTTENSINANWQEGVHNTGTGPGDNEDPHPGFGTHITGSTTGANGFDATNTGNASMYTVDVPTQQFVALSNTTTNKLKAGNPYLMFVRGDRSVNLTNDFDHKETILRATGSLSTGTQTQNFPARDNPAPGDKNFVMFGNPYQSAVDVASVFANSGTTNINPNHYYVYDPFLGDYGSYVTVTFPSTGVPRANQYLQPGQGAQAITLDSGASTVVFKESNKAPGNFTNTNRNPMSENDMLTVQLYTTENFNNGGSMHDSFTMFFAEEYDNGLTPRDAVKATNFYENLGIDHEGTYLSVEYREMPQASEVYPLYSTGYTYSDYTLKMTVDGLENTFLYLNDNFTGTSTLLEAGENSYSFSVDASDPLSKATDRFSIRTEQRLGVNDNDLLAGIRLYPNPLNADTFYINAPRLNGEQLQVTINDLSGRKIFEQTLECQANTVTVQVGNKIASGVYLVTLKNGGEAYTYRLIKE